MRVTSQAKSCTARKLFSPQRADAKRKRARAGDSEGGESSEESQRADRLEPQAMRGISKAGLDCGEDESLSCKACHKRISLIDK
jgi:hypothetical protein